MIVRHRKGILKQLECRSRAVRFVVYGQHVEATLARGWHLAQKVACHQPQFSLLVVINRSFSWLYVTRSARLDLDKTESVFVPSDKVEFSAMMWRTVVAGNDDIALPPKVEVGRFFAATAGALVRRQVVWRKRAASYPVECSQRGLREAYAKHGSGDITQLTIEGAMSARCDGGHAASGTFLSTSCGNSFPLVFTSTTPASAMAPPTRETHRGTSPNQIQAIPIAMTGIR